jgi:hypothetical protein
MSIIARKKYIAIWDELSQEKEMIFLAGPRQAGKTTLAKEIAKKYKNNIYFNWDILSDKKKIVEAPTFFEDTNRVDDTAPLVIFDEIHKYKKWKNYLKGIYDEFHSGYLFLISGSGRLDVYQKGGDSLAGRYLIFHLFPFTISELSEKKRNFKEFLKDPLVNFNLNDQKITKKIWSRLYELSGFPDPFTKNKKTFWNKWSHNYINQIIREDIRDVSGIKNTASAALLFSLLPSRVGSPISINNLAGDVQVSFDTVKNWLDLFDSAYLIFRISPWTKKISRAIFKEKKIYLFNYPFIADVGSRFENMIAVELYKAIFTWNELGYGNFKLHYIRNKEKEEADFLISNNNQPLLLVEAKNSDDQPSTPLIKFQELLNVPAVQLVNKENIYKVQKNKNNKLLIITAHAWLSSLP